METKRGGKKSLIKHFETIVINLMTIYSCHNSLNGDSSKSSKYLQP